MKKSKKTTKRANKAKPSPIAKIRRLQKELRAVKAERDSEKLRAGTAEDRVKDLDVFARLDELEQDVGELKDRMDEVESVAVNSLESDVEALADRVNTLENEMGDKAEDSDMNSLESDVECLENRVDTLETKSEEASKDG